MKFSAIPGWGLLLALPRWVVARKSWRRSLWVQFPTSLGWSQSWEGVTGDRVMVKSRTKGGKQGRVISERAWNEDCRGLVPFISLGVQSC